jgi:hypothetical protein
MTQPLPPLPPIPEPAPVRRSWPARHRAPLIVSVTALAAIGAGVGVAFAAAGESSTTQGAASASTTAPASGATPSPTALSTALSTAHPTAHPAARARKGTRATIVSESGSTWTVRTKAGQSLVVTITPQTRFGTTKAPAMRAQFTLGESVVILGTVSNGTVTATRIAVPAPTAPTAPTAS